MAISINISDTKKATIQKDMIGLFFEDINYAADGGLYAEMIENRGFEFVDVEGHKGDYVVIRDGLYGWDAYPADGGKLRLVEGSPVSDENPHYLRFEATKPGAGFCNKAYDGVALSEGMTYKVSFYARNISGMKQISICVLDGNTAVAEGCVDLNISEAHSLTPWVKYETVIEAKKTVRGGKFVVSLSDPGVVEFDLISMMPTDAVAGIFRKDLFDKLQNLHPGFIRFPGGCIIEGNTLSNRYRFKDTLKPVEDRKSNWNRWAVHGNDTPDGEPSKKSQYSHYNQTYGIGYYEFFLLCDLLGAKPLPVLNVGLACQYQSYELVEIEDDKFQDFLQDAVDLIEFANGDENTKWGKVRAALGHKEPFGLEMVGIGNEQWETDKTRFFQRYTLFEQKIHAAYPDIKLIGSAGPDITSEKYTMAWDFIKESAKNNDSFVYAVDEHYYVRPEWLYDHTDFYDEYPRQVKVFSGEYAAHPEGSGTFNNYKANTLEGALAEAAFLTGVERNADVVVLASYAPLFARLGYTQWSPDMIWFDEVSSYGSPSYYVQKLYSECTGTVTLDTQGQEKSLREQGIYYNPTLDETTGKVYVKVVNRNTSDTTIKLEGCVNGKTAQMLYISGDDVNAYNSIEEPTKVEIIREEVALPEITLPANSFSVIVIE